MVKMRRIQGIGGSKVSSSNPCPLCFPPQPFALNPEPTNGNSVLAELKQNLLPATKGQVAAARQSCQESGPNKEANSLCPICSTWSAHLLVPPNEEVIWS